MKRNWQFKIVICSLLVIGSLIGCERPAAKVAPVLLPAEAASSPPPATAEAAPSMDAAGKSDKPAEAPKDPWIDSQASFSGFSVLIIPIPLTPETSRCDAKELGERLFAEMAKDPDSQALLARLYEGLKVELFVHPDKTTKPADLLAQPSDEFAVSLRANLFVRDNENLPDGRRSANLAGARWKRVRNSQAPTYSSMAKALDAQPDDFVALLLVANDFLLRKMPGWMLFDGRGADDIFSFEPPTESPNSLREKLDQQIAKYCERFQDQPPKSTK